MNKTDLTKIIDALEISLDNAIEVANDYHAKMAGYREYRHKRLDEEVNIVREALMIAKREQSTILGIE
jgi:hypothetical protein